MSRLPEPVISVKNVHKTFDSGRVHALQGLSMKVNAGELLVVIGLSGSGKSTLLRHINGLERPSDGQVLTFGEDVARLKGKPLRLLRRRVGFVFQQFHLVGRLTALENVLSGGYGRIKGPRYGISMWPQTMRQAALEQLDRVGLVDQAFQRADTLSGGQQQRVAIARTMFQQPEIVLADEPVASLDPESSESVMQTLFSICMEEGLTVVCSLHQVDLALGWAHRMVGLRDGRVVMDQDATQLTQADARRVYQGVGADEEELAELEREAQQRARARARRSEGVTTPVADAPAS